MKLTEIFNQIFEEANFNVSVKTKDILDDITDEKIGEEKYETWTYSY